MNPHKVHQALKFCFRFSGWKLNSWNRWRFHVDMCSLNYRFIFESEHILWSRSTWQQLRFRAASSTSFWLNQTLFYRSRKPMKRLRFKNNFCRTFVASNRDFYSIEADFSWTGDWRVDKHVKFIGKQVWILCDDRRSSELWIKHAFVDWIASATAPTHSRSIKLVKIN